MFVFHLRAHISDLVKKYNAYLIKEQDTILNEFFGFENYETTYRYTHLVNGVALPLTADEVKIVTITSYGNQALDMTSIVLSHNLVL